MEGSPQTCSQPGVDSKFQITPLLGVEPNAKQAFYLICIFCLTHLLKAKHYFLTIYYFVCILMFCLHLCLYEGVGITDSCEPPCGYWELNQGPPEEQPVLLTAEPSLQLPSEILSSAQINRIFFPIYLLRRKWLLHLDHDESHLKSPSTLWSISPAMPLLSWNSSEIPVSASQVHHHAQ